MPLYHIKELEEFLASIGAAPNKTLSQNFLIDGNILQKIVTVAGLSCSATVKKNWVLEIGPGPGALTQQLLPTCSSMIAIEKDYALAKALPRLELTPGTLEVIHDDCLKVNLQEIVEREQQRYPDAPRGKVVANLPYHITTPILERLLPLHKQIDTLVLMVQKEVAQRLCAKVGTGDYSSLTLFASFYSDVSYGFTVSRNCFYPKPSVDSAVVVFRLKPTPLTGKEEIAFFDLMHRAFQQRRKMLRASLKEFLEARLLAPGIEMLWQQLSLSKILPTARPETLSLEQWISFTQLLLQLQSTPEA
jgi:16S rRNA (adenine1518-N6/adenine1519-N6)-dimethyltransferase